MNFLQKLTLYLSLYFTLSTSLFAQVVDIPDPNLRAAIRDTLSLPNDAPLTQDHMLKLKRIGHKLRGISNLVGLEHATNLESLALHVNEITDIRPLAGLTKLFHLNLRNNEIVDISPIANLTALKDLRLRNNRIVDVTPLANLWRLEYLGLHNNHVSDVAPIANLQRLKHLDVSRNPAFDYTSLDALTLDHFIYDQTCEISPSNVRERIYNRAFPSIVSPWVGPRVLNRPDLSDIEKEATHDLWWSVWFGLRMKITPEGRLIIGNIDEAIRSRDEYLVHNPNMVFLTAVKLLTFPSVWFPPEWPHWINYNPNAYANTVNFTHPEVQDVVVDQALAVAGCGLLDGIFIDHWNEEIHYLKGHGPSLEDEIVARVNIRHLSKISIHLA